MVKKSIARGWITNWKLLLVWFGTRFLNLRLKTGVAFISWVFSLSPRLAAA